MDWFFIFVIGLLLYGGYKGRKNRPEDKKSLITLSDIQLGAGIVGLIILLIDI